MASLQVDKANPVEDVITATTKDPQVVAPPPAAAAPVEVEDEEDLPDLDEAPYAEKVEKYSDNEEDNDIEYSPFLDKENTPPFSYDKDSEPAFAHFNQDHDDDDFAEDDD